MMMREQFPCTIEVPVNFTPVINPATHGMIDLSRLIVLQGCQVTDKASKVVPLGVILILSVGLKGSAVTFERVDIPLARQGEQLVLEGGYELV